MIDCVVAMIFATKPSWPAPLVCWSEPVPTPVNDADIVAPVTYGLPGRVERDRAGVVAAARAAEDGGEDDARPVRRQLGDKRADGAAVRRDDRAALPPGNVESRVGDAGDERAARAVDVDRPPVPGTSVPVLPRYDA